MTRRTVLDRPANTFWRRTDARPWALTWGPASTTRLQPTQHDDVVEIVREREGLTEYVEERGGVVDHLQFRVLGPVQVLDHGVAIDVGGSKPRLVLVQLLLNPNRVVSTDTLVDAVWGEDPPPTARRSLQSHVAKLRAALGGDDGPLKSQAPGYVLAVDEAQIDLWRSEDLVRQARASLLSNPRGAHLLAQKAREWTGEPLGDLATHDQLVPQRRRLDQLWLDLIELELDAELALGDTAEVVERLESLVLDRPEHEPFWARLMTAYYRLGRQSDALRAFQRARTALVEAFGIDPSPELQRLELAILGQNAELDDRSAAGCPYKGLASYQLDDAEMFYGRDDLVAELSRPFARPPSWWSSEVPGPASLPRFGPAWPNHRDAKAARLASGGRHHTWHRASAEHLPGSRSVDVVIVDQFEELFTLTDDEATQREFVRLLLARVNDGDGPRGDLAARGFLRPLHKASRARSAARPPPGRRRPIERPRAASRHHQACRESRPRRRR